MQLVSGATGRSRFMSKGSLVEFVVDEATDEWINEEKSKLREAEIKLLNK